MIPEPYDDLALLLGTLLLTSVSINHDLDTLCGFIFGSYINNVQRKECKVHKAQQLHLYIRGKKGRKSSERFKIIGSKKACTPTTTKNFMKF